LGNQEARWEGERRGGWKIEMEHRIGEIRPSSRRESVRSGEAIVVAISRIAHNPILRIWGFAGETGIAGRPEHIAPVQGLGVPGVPVVSASANSPARSSVARPLPNPSDHEIDGLSWELQPATAASGTMTRQPKNARSVPDKSLINRPRITDFIKFTSHDSSDRPYTGGEKWEICAAESMRNDLAMVVNLLDPIR
jgi:hypothetical protein